MSRTTSLLYGLLLLAACGTDVPADAPPDPNDLPIVEDRRPGKLIFFGDEWMTGTGLAYHQSYPSLVRHYLDSLQLNWRVSNAAVAGETTAGGDERVQWVLQQGIDIFVLGLGYNDVLQSTAPDATRRALQSIIDKVKMAAPQASIVLVVPAIDEIELYRKVAADYRLVLLPAPGGTATAPPDAARLRHWVDQQLWPALQPLLAPPTQEEVK